MRSPSENATPPWKLQAEAVPSCRFYVEIDGVAQAVFTEVSGLQVEMTVTEYEEGGVNHFVHRVPGRVKVSNLTLKRGMAATNELFKWCMETAEGKILRRHVTVRMYDALGDEVAKWTFVNAYPVKWIGPQLSSSGNTAAIETLELAHEGLQVK
jgi:phage tail-like protein